MCARKYLTLGLIFLVSGPVGFCAAQAAPAPVPPANPYYKQCMDQAQKQYDDCIKAHPARADLCSLGLSVAQKICALPILEAAKPSGAY